MKETYDPQRGSESAPEAQHGRWVTGERALKEGKKDGAVDEEGGPCLQAEGALALTRIFHLPSLDS